ncbi:hypothetical protein UY3_03980 [Chelonia mydas]|uniref:Uncharacterized protein n=1 Tax=Chelonia mydas TaxID=8469 RepID=M7BLR4_CHEMY|nr:hypothetical protein UY3_03980 [Chelonia mydas]
MGLAARSPGGGTPSSKGEIIPTSTYGNLPQLQEALRLLPSELDSEGSAAMKVHGGYNEKERNQYTGCSQDQIGVNRIALDRLYMYVCEIEFPKIVGLEIHCNYLYSESNLQKHFINV